MSVETPYEREPGYALRYRDARFQTGSGPRTDRRERMVLDLLLRDPRAPHGPWLDMPSGAGRLTAMLGETAVRADRDPEMVRAGGAAWPAVCAAGRALPFSDQAFAGVLCLRLMQHLRQAAERIEVLRELRRVARQALVVSHFDACTLQHWRRCCRRLFGRPSHRVALSSREFADELRAAGWTPVRSIPLLRFVSEQRLVLALRETVSVATPAGTRPEPAARP